jgi:AcrR family transcriptional regulator
MGDATSARRDDPPPASGGGAGSAGGGGAPVRSGYHHGDLRSSLVAATTEIVGERGVGGFTVAEAARRSGVSSGAPFRHFADREALLAAAGVAATEELRASFEAAIERAPDPAAALSEVSAAFVTYAIENPAGFELTHGPRFEFRESEEMQEARRQMLALIWPLGLELAPDYESALDLIGTQLALANGMAVLAARGATRSENDSAEDIADRARRATRALVAGWGA